MTQAEDGFDGLAEGLYGGMGRTRSNRVRGCARDEDDYGGIFAFATNLRGRSRLMSGIRENDHP